MIAFEQPMATTTLVTAILLVTVVSPQLIAIADWIYRVTFGLIHCDRFDRSHDRTALRRRLGRFDIQVTGFVSIVQSYEETLFTGILLYESAALPR